ncbi:MAG: NAD-dependent epimerase/dehydratase family protein, partial [Gemmatimonadetes bacterium]|nr:NAD-dependent epimerase/dehydratase family protein [Gemmatimonadota bacterium]
EYSHLSGVERVLYASSGCSIYGANAPLPLVEGFMSDQLATPYQITKMLGELYANFFHNYHGLSVVRTRFFNSYGPGEVPGAYRNVIPNFIYWAMNRRPLPITGTGEETRDWTYVDDVVSGLLLATARKEADGEAFNIASGTETRVIDLAHMVNELTENPAGIEMRQRRRWDVHTRLLGSVEKARLGLGYAPKTDFRDGLQATVRWFQDNWDLITNTARF